jgi:uncharacterized protein YjbI with pentapeptide repeats
LTSITTDGTCDHARSPERIATAHGCNAHRLAFRGNREVRHTVIRVITAHLRAQAAVSWQRRDLDFTGVVFDGGDFTHAQFSGGTVGFAHSHFFAGPVNFDRASFCGGAVSFRAVSFSGGTVNFENAAFSGGTVSFAGALFSGGEVNFSLAADWSRPPTFGWQGTPPPGSCCQQLTTATRNEPVFADGRPRQYGVASSL